MDCRLILEEIQGLADSHRKHLADALAFIFNLESFPVISCALTFLARHIDIRQEIHLDLDYSVSVAALAATAFDIEAETPRLVAAHLSLWELRIKVPYMCEHSRIGCRIRPWSLADRRLVYIDDLVEILDSTNFLMLAGLL